MKKSIGVFILSALFASTILLQLNCDTKEQVKPLTKDDMIARGKYLVTVGGCNDCHSPKIFTEMGPVPDSSRLLSGHPSEVPIYNINPDMVGPGKWILTNDHISAWVGPWGISYTANLTPDKATGLGAVSEEMFIKTLREGKIKGVGRPILPPMPWPDLGKMTDEDLKSIYSYLQSLPPIHNEVPQPVPPNEMFNMNSK